MKRSHSWLGVWAALLAVGIIVCACNERGVGMYFLGAAAGMGLREILGDFGAAQPPADAKEG
jgi:hypothetical protein